MKTNAVVALRALAVTLFLASIGWAQTTVSRCADCHFANSGEAWRWHIAEWDRSAHGREGVGCEKCHGGDPTTFEPFLAHQGMLSSQNPASPIHFTNLPKTCGGCHPGPFVAFQSSKHSDILRQGNKDAPTCVTCHGLVGAFLPSPKSLAAECARCHGAGKVAQRTDLPAEGKMMLTSVREVRESLEHAKKLIKKVTDKTRRASLEDELQQAQVPLTEAVHAGHMFVFDQLQEREEVARTRAEILLEKLENPQPSIRK
jgi:hypothetical protein